MCGVADCLIFGRETPDEELRAIACRMAGTLLHRGRMTQECGWMRQRALPGTTAGFDSRPLSGRPSTDGVAQRAIRHCIHGEIYNFPEPARSAEGEAGGCLRLRGHSDTKCFCWRSNIGA